MIKSQRCMFSSDGSALIPLRPLASFSAANNVSPWSREFNVVRDPLCLQLTICHKPLPAVLHGAHLCLVR